MPARFGPEDYVLRALNAAEIAETCRDGRLRQSFVELSEIWLALAADVAAERGEPPPELSARP